MGCPAVTVNYYSCVRHMYRGHLRGVSVQDCVFATQVFSSTCRSCYGKVNFTACWVWQGQLYCENGTDESHIIRNHSFKSKDTRSKRSSSHCCGYKLPFAFSLLCVWSSSSGLGNSRERKRTTEAFVSIEAGCLGSSHSRGWNHCGKS